MAGMNGSFEYALDGHGSKPIGCMVIKIRYHEAGFDDWSDEQTIHKHPLNIIIFLFHIAFLPRIISCHS